jgi:hypothetical protein
MKITTPKGYIIELTTEEAEALFPELVRDVRRQLGGAGEGGHELTPQRLVRRVLRRHRIPPTQRALYRALYEADDDGLDFVSLAAAVGRSVEELSGVLGGLASRCCLSKSPARPLPAAGAGPCARKPASRWRRWGCRGKRREQCSVSSLQLAEWGLNTAY